MFEHADFSRYYPSFLTLAVTFKEKLNHVAENCYSGFLKVTKSIKEALLQ